MSDNTDKVLNVKIKMEGSAFDDPHGHFEVSRILQKLADTVERSCIYDVDHGCVESDSNGNYCATLEITKEAREDA